MSVYNKPDLKIDIGCNIPSYHKKINSINISSSNTGRNQQGNVKNYFSKNKFYIKNTTNISSENNIINYNNNIIPNSNINKVLTSANIKNKRIEINLNKNYSPKTSKINKSFGENTILFKHKQTTSHNNINDKIINYNIDNNNNKEVNINHSKSKNSLNNINININISKKIISTYYNKSKDKKNVIVKKKSINSLNNSNKKITNDNKCNPKKKNGTNCTNCNNKGEMIINNDDNNEIMDKKQSERIVTKYKNNDSYVINYYSNQNKNIGNNNSLGYFSTNSNMSTTTNKNTNINTSNIFINNNLNLTNNDIYSNYFSGKDIAKKNNNNIFNKIIKENKASFFSPLQSPINPNHTQGNINSIQNYLKYLSIGQKNKNLKNNPSINKTKCHKLSENNINFYHNNTESNIYHNNYCNSSNYETHANFTQNNYNKFNDELNIVTNLKRNRKCKISTDIPKIVPKNNDINNNMIKSPEELHFFYIKLLQKGKKLNFDINN